MTKRYPTVEEVCRVTDISQPHALSLGVRYMESIIKAACDLDRERREAPAEVEIDPCSDCPPAGYPTDKTRCRSCPRKSSHAPAEDRIDWAEYPWAKWAAKDADDDVWLFDRKPFICADREWNIVLGKISRVCNATIPGPWQDSLRARPENS